MDGAGRPWLSVDVRPNFERAALAGPMASSPRQHYFARRVRAPQGASPTVTPGRFTVVSVGHRAGALHCTHVALKSSLGSDERRATPSGLATAATLHPAIAGNDRMPRSQAFPSHVKLSWRRETFVVPEKDTAPPTRCRIEDASAIAFRVYADKDARGEPSDAPSGIVVMRARSPVVDLRGDPKIIVDIDEPSSDWTPYLHAEYRFRVGARSWPLLAERSGSELTLRLVATDGVAAADWARVASGDDPIGCAVMLTSAAVPMGGGSAAPSLSLHLPITVFNSEQGQPLGVSQATLIFGDPAYDRMLSSMGISESRRIGSDLFILALDREAYDRTTPILIAIGKRDAAGELLIGGRLSISRSRDKADPTNAEYTLPPDVVTSFTFEQLEVGLGVLQPGDKLLLNAAIGGEAISAQVSISRDKVVPPAPAVYHLMTLHGSTRAVSDAATALSASGPFPDIVEYPCLKEDLLAGYVRRRGLFVWPFAPEAKPRDRFGFLIKIDRSGGGQLPMVETDFETVGAPRSISTEASWSDEPMVSRIARSHRRRRRK